MYLKIVTFDFKVFDFLIIFLSVYNSPTVIVKSTDRCFNWTTNIIVVQLFMSVTFVNI